MSCQDCRAPATWGVPRHGKIEFSCWGHLTPWERVKARAGELLRVWATVYLQLKGVR